MQAVGGFAAGGFMGGPAGVGAPAGEVRGAASSGGGAFDAVMASEMDSGTWLDDGHVDAPLHNRRLLPSNAQEVVETDAQFDASLPIRWLEPPVSQGTPETGATGASDGSPAGLAGIAGANGAEVSLASDGAGAGAGAGVGAGGAGEAMLLGESARPGTAAAKDDAAALGGDLVVTASAGHMDFAPYAASLPTRRFLPSNPQGIPETDGPVAGSWLEGSVAVGATAGTQTGVAAGSDARDAVVSKVAGASDAGGKAAARTVPVSAPTPPATPTAHLDGSLHTRRFLPSNPQGTVELGAVPPPAAQPAPALPAPAQPAPAQPAPALPAQPAPVQPAFALETTPTLQPAPLPPAPVLPTPAAPAPQQPLTHQLATPLFSLASAGLGEHVMTLRVSPDDLGPLTVRAHIDGTGVRIELFAPGDAGREAVRHILPELRRGLEESGASLSLSSHNSPADSGKDGQGTGQGHGHGAGQGTGLGAGTRDPEAQPRRFGDTTGNGTDDQPHQPRQLPPGVVHDPSSPHRLDILV
ncbi:flagellar hook-length control protein FliK [Paenarthrobacter ilicis]|uniref:Flagellar hook-length control protein-like C-terminal domain-containing protein n=1 Tax=Paenarthrobacter ilicis TaxID=43665 RepID=A0ABX0TDM9_9MICC|nr:flagellar hook-length control protein FliK [Paenarthrobacter ilicis]MBM7792253.1 flagellar hook-length control protein FliK [Paenarthrobacter ilicis]NIJ00597.1 hypothetical protein [Paenarthrobacter ilicis]